MKSKAINDWKWFNRLASLPTRSLLQNPYLSAILNIILGQTHKNFLDFKVMQYLIGNGLAKPPRIFLSASYMPSLNENSSANQKLCSSLTHSHTMTPFDTPGKQAF